MGGSVKIHKRPQFIALQLGDSTDQSLVEHAIYFAGLQFLPHIFFETFGIIRFLAEKIIQRRGWTGQIGAKFIMSAIMHPFFPVIL